MAFIDIKDPKRRDEIVADYLSTIQRVREQNENDRAIGLARQIELEQTFKPIVSATEKATAAITNELKAEKNPTLSETNGLTAFDYYQKEERNDLDKYYGIKRTGNNEFIMGDKEVVIDANSNIIVDDKTYRGTTGLWSLIMLAAPKTKSFSNDDIKQYTDLARRTNVINNPQDLEQNSRPRQTVKYAMLETLLEEEKEGTGIQFLPGDIKGLTSKLNLLLAEYRAGNKSSTRNQIVSILDELQRRKRISKKEYRDINTFIAP